MTTTQSRSSTSSTSLRILQVLATLSVLTVLYQFVTAGELLPDEPSHSRVELHAAGAYGVHVFTFLVTAAAFWHYRRTSGQVWPTVLAGAVLVVGFVQAYYGNRDMLYIHIPGAMMLTAGAVWIMVWSFGQAAHAGR